MQLFPLTLAHLLWILLALDLGLANPTPDDAKAVPSVIPRERGSMDKSPRAPPAVDERASEEVFRMWEYHIPLNMKLRVGYTYFFTGITKWEDDLKFIRRQAWSRHTVKALHEAGYIHRYLVQVTVSHRLLSEELRKVASVHWWDMALSDKPLNRPAGAAPAEVDEYIEHLETNMANLHTLYSYKTHVKTPPRNRLGFFLSKISKEWRRNHRNADLKTSNPDWYVTYLLHRVSTHDEFEDRGPIIDYPPRDPSADEGSSSKQPEGP